ncbi:MAG: DUF2141 domain-containing protein [Pseudosphingobacterium sp.]|nr:DUF2141 domain-containing protein [Pseudosphingobacterium sp.]
MMFSPCHRLLFCLFTFVFCYIGLRAQQKSVLRVDVCNLKNNKGVLYAALYRNQQSFLNEKECYASKIVESNHADTLSFFFEELPIGKYALAIFFDKNGNGRMDKNFLGIPKEPFGFSARKMPLFKAPRFDEASFVLKPDNNKLVIKLISF